MLKKITVRNREIPVPVPILTLKEAIHWIESTLLKKEAAITGVFLDGKEVTGTIDDTELRDRELCADSDLSVCIDNPMDLSLQTIEMVGDLSFVLADRLKTLAVELWSQDPSGERKHSIKEAFADIELMFELVDHLNGILEYSHPLLAPINALYHLIKSAYVRAKQECTDKAWRSLAKTLVTRIEVYLRNLSQECEGLQLELLTETKQDPLLKAEFNGR